MTGEAERYLAVAAGLFILGAIGFITRRNLIMIVLSAEMMLHGVSLTFVTFGQVHHTYEGQAFTIFALTVAASEAGLALALVLALFQSTKSLDIDLWTTLREPDLSPPATDVSPPEPVDEAPLPKLPPAGRVPILPQQTDLESARPSPYRSTRKGDFRPSSTSTSTQSSPQ